MLTLGSLFDGIGGWLISAKHAGIKPLWASEIDDFPAAVTAHHFPEVKQLGDITKINGAEIEPVDIICAGSPCLTADSLVLTIDGYKPIADVKVGEQVLTKSNTWQKVVKKFDNGVHETCYISGTGFENIHCTPNHKFWVRTGKRKGHFGKRFFSEPEFVQAKDLTTKHYIGLPIIETEKSFYTDDKDFWWLIGYYLGDGWLAKRQYDIQLACNESKLAKLKEHISKEKYRYTVQDNGTCYRLRFADKEMYNFIQQNIGTGCCEKHISLDIINLPKEQLLQVYEGYLASDGCVIGDKHQFSSVNRRMLYEFMLIINKLFHKWACIYKVKTKDKTIIDGRIVNQKDWYQLRFSPLKKKQDHSFVENGYLWLAFRKRESANVASVYNMEVENDHSYIVQGVISKNCQDLSVAGKREGLKGERSGLFHKAIDIVRQMRMSTGGRQPRYFVWENVPGAFSSNGGMDFRAVLSEVSQTEIPIPANNKWAEAGMVEWNGGSLAWRCLDAQYWGVPQRRKRIFLVADFGGYTAGKILFECQGLSRNFTESEGTRKGSSESTGTSTDSASKCVDYSFDSVSSNSMKSANPYSGCREVDKAGTLDTTQPNPAKNQGGIAIHSYSIAGNTIGRKLENGGNGKGVLPECSYTLNTTDRHAVFREGSFGSFVEDTVAGTSKASGGVLGGGSETLIKES